jgi:hypothetical protein
MHDQDISLMQFHLYEIAEHNILLGGYHVSIGKDNITAFKFTRVPVQKGSYDGPRPGELFYWIKSVDDSHSWVFVSALFLKDCSIKCIYFHITEDFDAINRIT